MKIIVNIIIVAAVLIGANFLVAEYQPQVEKKSENAQPKQKLRQRVLFNKILREYDPQVVFLGNSMVTNNFDSRFYSQITRTRSVNFSLGGSSSAWWYLVTKNIILASPKRPRVIVLFFRDTALTEPAYRTTGKYEKYIKEMSNEDEPLLKYLAYNRNLNPVRYYLREHVELMSKSREIRADFNTAVKDDVIGSIFDLEAGGVQKCINNQFAWKNLNRDQMTLQQQIAEDAKGKKRYDFNVKVKKSFLPEIVQMTRENNIKLVLLRVKKRRDIERNAQEIELLEYIEQLSQYAADNNIPFYDFSDDPRLKLEHYANGDHLDRQKGRPLFTKMVAQKIFPYVNSVLKKSLF